MHLFYLIWNFQKSIVYLMILRLLSMQNLRHFSSAFIGTVRYVFQVDWCAPVFYSKSLYYWLHLNCWFWRNTFNGFELINERYPSTSFGTTEGAEETLTFLTVFVIHKLVSGGCLKNTSLTEFLKSNRRTLSSSSPCCMNWSDSILYLVFATRVESLDDLTNLLWEWNHKRMRTELRDCPLKKSPPSSLVRLRIVLLRLGKG